jgi:hypothetical protein
MTTIVSPTTSAQVIIRIFSPPIVHETPLPTTAAGSAW